MLHIHRFDPKEVQFGDALVSSAIVWFSKKEPPDHHKVRMTYGGSLLRPSMERLIITRRYAPTRPEMDAVPDEREPLGVARSPVLADFFTIKRGLATGGNRYFILSTEEIAERGLPAEVFRPILPSPRYVPDNEILADRAGNPVLERQLFLLDCRLPEEKVKERYPTLGAYLEEGKVIFKAQGIARTLYMPASSRLGMHKSAARLRRSFAPTSVAATRKTGDPFDSY